MAIIAIISGILGMFFGYERGEAVTQIKTIETLNGMQNIDADNVTINYYSDTDDYEEKLNKTVSEVNTLIKENEILEDKNLKIQDISDELLKQNTQLIQEKNDYNNKFRN